MKTYGNNVLSVIWYLEVEQHEDGTVTILKHYSLHRTRDENHPKVEDTYRLVEDKDRTVTGVTFGSDKEVYTVRNPKNVFSYK